jgi:hypothetical protein
MDDVPLLAEGHLRLAAILMNRGELAASEVELRRCLEFADDLGSHRIESEATSWLGMITYHLGDSAEGEQLCRRARTWFERTGDVLQECRTSSADWRPSRSPTVGPRMPRNRCERPCRSRCRSAAGS